MSSIDQRIAELQRKKYREQARQAAGTDQNRAMALLFGGSVMLLMGISFFLGSIIADYGWFVRWGGSLAYILTWTAILPLFWGLYLRFVDILMEVR